MNSRIKELAEQCMETPEVLCYYGHRVLNSEKFAELIVGEALGVWHRMDNGNSVEGFIEMEDYPRAVINYFGIGK